MQKRGQMIPLLQQFQTGLAASPVPAEAVPEAEGFAALMDQPAASQTDEVAALMVAVIMPPLAALSQRGMQGPQSDQTEALSLPKPANTSETALFNTPGIEKPQSGRPTELPLLENFDDAQSATQDAESTSVRSPATASGQVPFVQGADVVLVTDHGEGLLPQPKTKAANIREIAFLASLEPTGAVALASPPQDTEVAVIVAATIPLATAMPPPARPLFASSMPRDLGVQDISRLVQFATPEIAAKSGVPQIGALVLELNEAKVDPSRPILAEQQVIPLSLPDRPSVVPPTLAPGMPSSVSTGLLAHAPQAALGPVEVVLNPEELGKIRFEIHHQGDQVKVVLAVERPETLELLRRHADQLVQEFRAAGYAGASLSFGQWGQQQNGSSGQLVPAKTDPQSPDDPRSPEPLRTAPLPPVSLAQTQGLNLRL